MKYSPRLVRFIFTDTAFGLTLAGLRTEDDLCLGKKEESRNFSFLLSYLIIYLKNDYYNSAIKCRLHCSACSIPKTKPHSCRKAFNS